MPVPLGYQNSVMPLDHNVDNGADGRTETDSDKDQASFAGVEPTKLLPNDRENGKGGVEDLQEREIEQRSVFVVHDFKPREHN